MTRFYLLVLTCLVGLGACKKTDTRNNGDSSATLHQKILAETRDNYLWAEQIPQNFDPNSYAGPEELMEGIRQFSMEPGFSQPVDYYSFAIKKAEWDNISSGVAADFGLNVFFMNDSDLRVRAVEKESPAGAAGIRRGWKIVKVGTIADITVANAEALADQIYNSQNTAFTFQLPDGSTRDITLSAVTYQEQPLYLDTIYTDGTKKIGYLVFNSFLGKINDVATSFGTVFNNFVTNGVTDVVVDLRYNGGGYVSLQQTLANYLVKTSANGSIMMNEVFNSKHSNDNVTVKFEKKGNLDINRIYFIVSSNTASASELLINNLKPYMDVKLIGGHTYGKPVGFFDIPVDDWLIFPVSFRSTNGVGEGNYFSGIAVDKDAADGLDKDWGDRQESGLATALAHITTGSFGYAAPGKGLNSTLESGLNEVNRKLKKKTFIGAVAN